MPQNWPGNALSSCQFKSAMRFKIDENLPLEVAHLLREEGHEATTVAEQGSFDKETLLRRLWIVEEERIRIRE